MSGVMGERLPSWVLGAETRREWQSSKATTEWDSNRPVSARILEAARNEEDGFDSICDNYDMI
jgi:hypothetical protein